MFSDLLCIVPLQTYLKITLFSDIHLFLDMCPHVLDPVTNHSDIHLSHFKNGVTLYIMRLICCCCSAAKLCLAPCNLINYSKN